VLLFLLARPTTASAFACGNVAPPTWRESAKQLLINASLVEVIEKRAEFGAAAGEGR
jgi:hypothetical protein